MSDEVTVEAAVEASRNEALELAESLMGESEPAEKPAPSAPAKKVELAAAVEAEATPPEEENRIAVVMRAKKQAQRVREEAESKANAMLADLEARTKRLDERERAFVGRLREKPIDALREAGIDPREFFERAVDDPKQLDPVAQLKHEMNTIRAELKAERDRADQSARQAAERQRGEGLNNAKRQFVNETLSSEGKFPTLQAFFSDNPERLASEALAVVNEYAKRGGDPNDISNNDIAEFLEKREAERYTSIRNRLERVGETAQSASGISLTSKDVSSKASRSKKTEAELSPEDGRNEALKLLEERFEEERLKKKKRA